MIFTQLVNILTNAHSILKAIGYLWEFDSENTQHLRTRTKILLYPHKNKKIYNIIMVLHVSAHAREKKMLEALGLQNVSERGKTFSFLSALIGMLRKWFIHSISTIFANCFSSLFYFAPFHVYDHVVFSQVFQRFCLSWTVTINKIIMINILLFLKSWWAYWYS